MSEIHVTFSPETPRINAAWARRVVQTVLDKERSKKNVVNVYLTGNREIREINRKFLNHNFETDVISFGRAERGFLGEEENYLGDVVVSAQMAKQTAKELKVPFKEELGRYLVHGTLHLLGYDDHAPKDKRRMFKRQEAILEKALIS